MWPRFGGATTASAGQRRRYPSVASSDAMPANSAMAERRSTFGAFGAPASSGCSLLGGRGGRGRRRHLHPGGRHWWRWRRGGRRRHSGNGCGFGAPCRDRVRIDGSRRVEPPQLLLGFTDAQLLLRQGAREVVDLVERDIAPLQRRRETAFELLDLLRERVACGACVCERFVFRRRRRLRRTAPARSAPPARRGGRTPPA